MSTYCTTRTWYPELRELGTCIHTYYIHYLEFHRVLRLIDTPSYSYLVTNAKGTIQLKRATFMFSSQLCDTFLKPYIIHEYTCEENNGGD